MSKKPTWYDENLKKLEKLCKELHMEWAFVDRSQYQVRVLGATHVFDIWPSRMVYHRVSGEVISAEEKYHHLLDQEFNKQQVKKLLETGKL